MAYIVDGVYNIDEQPPVEVQGVSTGTWGIVGTFSKGPVNTPTLCSSLNDLKNTFGGADSTLTGYIGALTAYGQGATQYQVVRITGSGAASASVVVKDSSNGQVFTATYLSVGTGGNNASLVVSAGTKAGTFKVVTNDGDTVEPFDNVVTVLPANPTSAPTLLATGTGGTLPAGTYQVGYTFTTSSGETLMSPTSSVTISAGQNIQVSALTLPATITGVNYYLSVAAGSTTLAFDVSGTGAQITLTALPAAGAANPPATNTAQNGFNLVTSIASKVASFTQPGTPNTNLPISGTYPLSGGANGTAPVLSAYIGSQNPNTGMYALAGASPAVNQFFLAGQSPSDSGSVQTISAFCKANDMLAAVCAAQGTTSAAAKALTANLDTDRVVFCWPWQQMFVQDLNQTLTVPPTGYWVGLVSTLYPHQSPGNKNLAYTSGPEFAVSSSDITTCLDSSARIVPIGVSIPRGGIGCASGATLSQTKSINPVYRRRMDDFIVESVETALGQFVDEPIITTPGQDDLLSKQESAVSAFLHPLTTSNNEAGQPMIASYSVQCDLNNNPTSVTQNDMTVVDTKVQLWNMNRFLLFRTTIGAGVITTTSLGAQ